MHVVNFCSSVKQFRRLITLTMITTVIENGNIMSVNCQAYIPLQSNALIRSFVTDRLLNFVLSFRTFDTFNFVMCVTSSMQASNNFAECVTDGRIWSGAGNSLIMWFIKRATHSKSSLVLELCLLICAVDEIHYNITIYRRGCLTLKEWRKFVYSSSISSSDDGTRRKTGRILPTVVWVQLAFECAYARNYGIHDIWPGSPRGASSAAIRRELPNELSKAAEEQTIWQPS